jgi:hypothetical protein
MYQQTPQLDDLGIETASAVNGISDYGPGHFGISWTPSNATVPAKGKRCIIGAHRWEPGANSHAGRRAL